MSVDYYKISNKNKAVDAKYCRQLENRAQKTVYRKNIRPSLINSKGILLLHVNTGQHIDQFTQGNSIAIIWKVYRTLLI